jgi:hypothetical protein
MGRFDIDRINYYTNAIKDIEGWNDSITQKEDIVEDIMSKECRLDYKDGVLVGAMALEELKTYGLFFLISENDSIYFS